MTGQPAETWRKFNFGTIPVFAPALGHVATHFLERRAIGHLPLTRASNRRVALRTAPGLLIGLLGLACWTAAVVIAYSSAGADVTPLEIPGFFAMPVAVVGFLIGRRSIGPQGTVVGSVAGEGGWVVEIWNLHPAFVAAVQLQQAQRSRAGISS